MSRRSRRLLIILAALLALLLLAVAVLPMVVDVNRFRPLIESSAREALGRPVTLGEMRLALLPRPGIQVRDVEIGALPGEGDGTLLTASSVAVGARLIALLQRRMEITTITVDGPSLTLSRDAAGAWNVQRLLAGGGADSAAAGTPAAAAPSSGAAGFSISRLILRDGRLTVRDAFAAPGHILEATLGEIRLDLRDLAPDRSVTFDLAALLEGAGGTRITASGSAGPMVPPAGTPFSLDTRLAATDLAIAPLTPWLAVLAGPGLAGEGGLLQVAPFSFSLQADGSLGEGGTGVSLHSLVVDGVHLSLRRDRQGRWNLPALAGGGGSGAGPAPASTIAGVAGIDLRNARVDVEDAAGGGAPLAFSLVDLGLTLDHLPHRAAGRLAISTQVEVDGARGRMAVQGNLGPLDSAWPAELDIDISELPAVVVQTYLGEVLTLPAGLQAISLKSQLAGDLAGVFTVAGEMQLKPVSIRYDIGAAGGGTQLEFNTLEVSRGKTRLAVRGSLDRRGAQAVAHLELLPTQVPVSDLLEILTLAGIDMPLELSGKQPLGLAVQVDGPVGGAALPQLQGRIEVKDLTLSHPFMSRPIDAVTGVVSFKGETIKVESFTARLGPSDVEGSLTLQSFTRPRVTFAARSRQADFWDLMSFVAGGSSPSSSGGSGGQESSFLDQVAASGTLEIQSGSFNTLAFTGLKADLRLDGQAITLEPFGMDIYDGRFEGSARLDFAASPLAFVFKTDLKNVDALQLLDKNLDLGDALTGRLTTSLNIQGAGASYEAIVRSLTGGGPFQLEEGRVGRIDVLKTLSKASGVFGETSLKSVSAKLAEEGTPFSRLAGTLVVTGQELRSDDLSLASPDLDLRGKVRLDILAGTQVSAIKVVFSEILSNSMRAEGSRAASVFWDGKQNRVSMPLSLTGPLSAPVPGIDWGAAASQLLERKATDKVKEKLGDRLGGLLGGKRPATATAAAEPEANTAAGQAAANTGAAATPGTDAGVPHAAITSTRWGSSMLAPDLKIQGLVRGSGPFTASFHVLDARGRTLWELASIPAVAQHEGGESASVPFDLRVEGKKLLLSPGPYRLLLTVRDAAGLEARAETEVSK